MRKLSLMILSLCMLLLSGCATIDSDVKIDSDGSGTWNAQINSQAGPLPKDSITEIINEYNIQDYTIKALDDQGKEITVDNGDETPYNVWTVNSKFNNVEELTVTVSGEIDPASVQTGTLTDKNTVTFTQNSHIRFIFKPSHGWLFYIGIGVAIVAVIGGGYIFYLRRKYYGDAA